MEKQNPKQITRKSFLTIIAVCLSAIGGLWFVKFRNFISGKIIGPDPEIGHRIRSNKNRDSYLASGSENSETIDVLILGAGVSGLSTGYYLRRFGFSNFKILELESESGGNSKSGKNEVGSYPWGAHYLPQPSEESVLVRKFLEENRVIVGKDKRGNPVFDERYLCFDPEERIFYQGKWNEGLFPGGGTDSAAGIEERKFKELIRYWRNKRGKDGKKAFTIPIDLSSRDPEILKLDRIHFFEYIKEQGFSSRELFWFLDYSVRDDFGGSMDTVSAWIGLHYFCSRPVDENGEDLTLLTWPEGNGFLVNRLKDGLENRIQTRTLVERVLSSGTKRGRFEVRTYSVETKKQRSIFCDSIVYALPSFTRKYVLGETSGLTDGLTYSPWMVANLTVDRVPAGKGIPPCWDNVVYQSPSLGYIVSTHQDLRAGRERSVLTYYHAFGQKDTVSTRKRMMKTSWSEWKDSILSDLKKPHPDIEKRVSRIDVAVYAHAMIRPVPGFIWGEQRRKLALSYPHLHFAHSDLSGISIFEESLLRGHEAALKILGEKKI
ncbi:NAD(P)/FAD-dependent oxidoreductase [Leptospira gomenensis]|uniref:NAD(P)/FAD-dependent oxidoreductase n=1 Tax=Leptospira gomenensis TaxID=2484974 RepID=A0A5F1Y769_9LEPT|nr:NAD(P)-binding protein [Leptospira gomenensis]TGK28066.1 NAD(P)/FAD-dependent oxidoreductase [Leptospira gomenensis]TGK37078.1 NAD(P)/FAD-dependent oxidoreductase [Leptospira gomenensis]TGK45714.1 NAD(P)/FAD-dependent oxidoreductase [Leptospira gomenensis]TGK59653.1 NAD(P)/FAD-dependent oxidoreductase [Leptospira gomenensis]